MRETINNSKLYFPNLNGLRAIGAFIVMIGHVAVIRSLLGLPHYSWFPIPGKVGVTLFFVLSGFLITSLLLRELNRTQRVRLKEFYVRRILRIWPLYYLLVLLGLVVFNRVGFLQVPHYSNLVYQHMSITNLLILLFILPNFTGYYIPYTDQRWSIVVEEQFYLIQPLLVKIFKKRKLLYILFLIILFSANIFNLIVDQFGLEYYLSTGVISSIHLQLKYFGCIAVGCLFSLTFFKRKKRIDKIIYSRFMQYFVLILLFVSVVAGTYIFKTEELIDYRIYALLFGFLVVNAAQNKGTVYKMETPVFNFLGKISYGIYMYHPVCIGITIFMVSLITRNILWQDIIIYPIAILLTVLVAWLSFNYFEMVFLRLKTKFQSALVRSRQPDSQSEMSLILGKSARTI